MVTDETQEPAWRALAQRLLSGSDQVVNVTMASNLDRVRLLKAPVKLEYTSPWGPVFVWDPKAPTELIPVSGFLDRLVGLAGAQDARDFEALASEFGSLGAGVLALRERSGSIIDMPEQLMSVSRGSRVVMVEPVCVWQTLARGLAVLLGCDGAGSEFWSSVDSNQLEDYGALSAVAALAWLQNPDLTALPDNRDNLASLRTLFVAHFADRATERVDSAIGALTGTAQFATGSRRRRSFALVPVGMGSPDVTGRRSVLLIRGLAQVIGIQFAAVRRRVNDRYFNCPECGGRVRLPAGKKSVRTDQPYYGNHEQCRKAARLRSQRESQKRSYQAKKAWVD